MFKMAIANSQYLLALLLNMESSDTYPMSQFYPPNVSELMLISQHMNDIFVLEYYNYPDFTHHYLLV